MVTSRAKGKKGEQLAIQFLLDSGYTILHKNYQKKIGEIDIIARKDAYVCFIEVKYRKNLNNGYPREAVSLKKQDKIKNTALFYISEYDCNNVDFRFDVIEIIQNEIIHIENAFY